MYDNEKKNIEETKSNNILLKYRMMIIFISFVVCFYYLIKYIFIKISSKQQKIIKKFFSKYDIIGIFIGWSISSSSRDFSKSVIDNLIMPLFGPLHKDKTWKSPTVIGPFSFYFGNLISEMLHVIFTIIFVFIIYHFLTIKKII